MKSLSGYVKKGLFFKSVVEEGSDVIFIVDYEGQILYCNNSIRDLGYKATNLIGKNFFDFIKPDLLLEFKKTFKVCTQRRFTESIEFQFLCKDNTYTFFEFNSINLKQKDGLKGLILDCRDISQRKKDAEELLRAQKAKELFLANISHEIRTPINGIAGMADLLSQNPSAEDQTLYLKAIKTASENLKVIINDILDLASIESGKLKFEKINFNLDKTIRSLVDTFRLQSQEKGIKLEYKKDAKIPNVYIGDPVRLNQILINLISNALKFTQHGSISISVSLDKIIHSENYVKFEIRDTGIGIPKSKLKTIFESFSQADASVTRKYGGTGLGLTIVRQLVQLQHGSIKVESEESKGSVFTVIIPYKQGISDEQLGTGKSGSTRSLQLQSASILLVEDNDINRLYAGSILKMWGCPFDTAENGEVAIEKLKNAHFDLILMDIQMPIMDGFEATKEIRNWANEKSEIPIVALTANATQRDTEKCLALGMNDCLTKPFTQEDLLKILDKYLGNKFHVVQSVGQNNSKSKTDKIDFSYLEKVSGNNKDFIREIAEAFIKSIPTSIQELDNYSENENWVELARVAHKIKPSITLLGVHSLKDKIVKLEDEARLHQNPWQITKLSKEVSSELKDTLESLKVQISFYS
jgi:PAS domain S-box-containing protein